MSWNRESVIWQSKDTRWNVGYFASYSVGDTESDDYDAEWDVEYIYDEFSTTLTGYASKDSALTAMRNYGNSGYPNDVLPYKGNSGICKKYDLAALHLSNPKAAKAEEEKIRKAQVRKQVAELSLKVNSDPSILKKNLSVTVKLNKETWGATLTITGYAEKVGDWLMLGKRKVYNTKTKKVAPDIIALTTF